MMNRPTNLDWGKGERENRRTGEPEDGRTGGRENRRTGCRCAPPRLPKARPHAKPVRADSTQSRKNATDAKDFLALEPLAMFAVFA